jgi:hypothetical protein
MADSSTVSVFALLDQWVGDDEAGPRTGATRTRRRQAHLHIAHVVKHARKAPLRDRRFVLPPV